MSTKTFGFPPSRNKAGPPKAYRSHSGFRWLKSYADDRLEGARLFHFGYPPIMRRMYADGGKELASLFSRVKRRGITTSLDMAMPDPHSEAGRADWTEILARTLPSVDIFLPSLEEILFMLDREHFERLSGGDHPASFAARGDAALLSKTAERLLSMGAAVVGLKLGDQGLYVRTTSDAARLENAGSAFPSDRRAWVDRELVAPCFSVEVAGTTGSGDCTIAGFLACLLRGLPIEETMTRAVAVGACNVEKPDATSGVPAWSDLEERLRSDWERRPLWISLPGWNRDEAVFRSPREGKRPC